MTKFQHLLIFVLFVITYLVIADLYIAIGLSLTFYFAVSFISKLGKQIPILELLILLALAQWFIGPFIDYITPTTHFKYYMYVGMDRYFDVVIPALIAFILPIILLKSTTDIPAIDRRIRGIMGGNKKLPWVLIIIGFVAEFIFPFVPGVLAFVFFILSQFKYIGLIYMFFSDVKYDKYLLYFIFLLTILSSVRSGFFHDLLLWSALFLTFIVYKFNWSLFQKVAIVVVGLVFSVVTQSIKADYREIINERPEYAGLELFSNLAYNKVLLGGIFESEESINELNVRLNQGWIISAIINHVPDYEPYANGETIEDAISASLLPRFIDTDKKKAGGRENFMRFTGLQLMDATSMGTSILGEAYANYGQYGSAIFMFFWGMFLVGVHNFILKISKNYPSLLLWLPLIFLQALKAETELVVVLNHIVKSSILVFLFFWIATKTLKWRL